MKRLLLLLAACLALNLPSAAQAVNQTSNYFKPSDLGISGALLSGSPAFTIQVSAFQAVTVVAALTRAAATGMVITCSAGPTAGVLAPVSVAGPNSTTGNITMVDGTFVWSGVSTSRNFRAVITPINDNWLTCILTAPGATSDTVSAHVLAVGAR